MMRSSRISAGRTPLLPVHVMVDKRRALHAEALAMQPDWPVIPMASAIEAMASRRAPVGVFLPQVVGGARVRDLWRRIEHRLAA